MKRDKRKVLVVEDDEPQSRLIAKLLEGESFEAIPHTHAKPALARDDIEEIDVAIIDLRLPDMDGVELLSALQKRNPHMRVIIHTGFATIDTTVAAVNERAFAFVRKAGAPEELMTQVHHAFHQRLREHSERLEALVSERTRDLEASEARLATFLLSSPDEIHVLNDEGIVEFSNRGTAGTLLEATHFSNFFSEPVARLVEEHLADVMDGGARYESELAVGDQWYAVRLARFLAGRNVSVMVVTTDITSRRKTEEALRESEERLRLSQKLEAVGRLAGGIAHDFNNLLTVISGYASVLSETLREGRLRRDAYQILRAADRGSNLTNQLLAFSRKQPLVPKALDLNEVVRDMEPMLGRLMGDDMRFIHRLDPDLGLVYADPGQLEQVLMNLAINARDAMPGGGDLTVTTTNARLVDDPAGAGVSTDYVLLTVRDNGDGMSPTVLEHAFEPFFTTKEVGKGTGLGLSTVYGIVDQSGGRVVLESEPGKGTTVSVYLPIHETDGLRAERSSETTEPAGVDTKTILVVEDEDSVRELIVLALEQRGYNVRSAASGAQALEQCAAAVSEPIDLLLTDVVMPGIDGPSLAARLKDYYPGAATLFVSGYARDLLDERFGGVRDYQFLKKPFTPDVLARSVQDALRDGEAAAGAGSGSSSGTGSGTGSFRPARPGA